MERKVDDFDQGPAVFIYYIFQYFVRRTQKHRETDTDTDIHSLADHSSARNYLFDKSKGNRNNNNNHKKKLTTVNPNTLNKLFACRFANKKNIRTK